MAKNFPIESYIKTQKSGILQFRMKVPKDLVLVFNQTEFTVSLKTKDHALAQGLAYDKLRYYQDMVDKARLAGDKFVNLSGPKKDVKSEAAQRFKETTVRTIFRFYKNMPDENLMWFYHNLKSGAFMKGEFDKFLTEHHIYLNEDHPEYGFYLSEFTAQADQQIRNTMKFRRVDALLAIKTADAFDDTFLATDRQFGKPTPLVSQLYAEFLDQHPKIRDDKDERARSDNVVACFTDFVGDVPANYIRKNQTRDFIVQVAQFPARRDGKSAKMKFQDVISYHIQKGEYDTLSLRTVKVWIAKLKRLYAYAVDNYEDQYSIKNPFNGVDKYAIGKPNIEKRNFTEGELSIIFNDPIFQGERDHLFWSPILLLHHGCRASELLNQPLSSVKQDKEGLWYIDVTNGKTDRSVRRIPLHTYVLNDLDFIGYVQDTKARGERWLFPQFKREGRVLNGVLRPSKDPSAQYSQWVGRWMDRLGLNDPTISMHSWRHTFISTAAKLKIPKEYRTAITGHVGADIHEEVYTHHELATLKSELDRIRFEGFPYDKILSR